MSLRAESETTSSQLRTAARWCPTRCRALGSRGWILGTGSNSGAVRSCRGTLRPAHPPRGLRASCVRSARPLRPHRSVRTGLRSVRTGLSAPVCVRTGLSAPVCALSVPVLSAPVCGPAVCAPPASGGPAVCAPPASGTRGLRASCVRRTRGLRASCRVPEGPSRASRLSSRSRPSGRDPSLISENHPRDPRMTVTLGKQTARVDNKKPDRQTGNSELDVQQGTP